MRWWLWIDSFLVLSAGIQLFVLTEQTDRFFAWTINPPITAAFLGASYWGGLALVFLSSRERLWTNARPSVPGIWLFTVLTLAATLLHLGRFHMNSPFGWVWLAVYVAVPLALPVLFYRQQFGVKLPDPPRLYPLPGWLRISLIIMSAILVLVGIALFAVPEVVSPIWPWMLTPLTARAVAAWLIGIGAVIVNVLWEADLRRAWVALIATTVLELLQMLAVTRYAASLDWGRPQIWVYLVLLLWVTAMGAAGW
jgi:hypothetical protein